MSGKALKKNQSVIPEYFPRQRLVVMPSNIIDRCKTLPVVQHLYVTHIGCFPSAPDHLISRPDGTEDAILIYCLAGEGSLQLNDSVFKITKGTAFAIPPNIPHIYASDIEKPWSVFWVHFNGTEKDACLQTLSTNKQHPLLYAPDTSLIRAAFENTYACINYKYSDAGLLAMSSELLRMIATLKMHQKSLHPQQQAVEDRVKQTITFMLSHLDMSLTLEELAANAQQSVPHYCRLFKEQTGQTPIMYFIQQKIHKACHLLDETDLSVSEIAAELGYDDPYYFSRIFKKIQGCSPAFYRKSIKG